MEVKYLIEISNSCPPVFFARRTCNKTMGCDWHFTEWAGDALKFNTREKAEDALAEQLFCGDFIVTEHQFG